MNQKLTGMRETAMTQQENGSCKIKGPHAAVFLSPQQYQAVIFDMDGVVTQTAKVHAAAWKKLFDAFLQANAARTGKPFVPFDIESDYLNYVDGKAREDGIRSFLASRGITLPEGRADAPSAQDTVASLGQRKNRYFLEHLHTHGVEAYDSTVSLIQALRRNHIKTAIISASKNCQEILQAAKLTELFDTRVDGLDAQRLHLPGKPQPDIFLQAAKQLDVSPEKAVVVEDALAGVQAGVAGHFGLVIGVDRDHQSQALKAQGADVVVDDLCQVSLCEKEESSLHHSNLQKPDGDLQEWSLIYDEYVPGEEGRRETLCALGNGYFVTRAAASESRADSVHYPGTYLAGGYNRLQSHVNDRDVENEDLVNFPNWLVLRFRIHDKNWDEDWIDLDHVDILSYQQCLNLKEGVYYRDVHFRDAHNRQTKLSERRLVHMAYAHYAALEVTFTPVNWFGSITIHTALDGTVINDNVKSFRFLNKKHLESLQTSLLDDESIFLKVQTNQSEIRMAQAAKTVIFQDGERSLAPRNTLQNPGYIAQEITVNVTQDQPVRVEKLVMLYTSRDNAISECGYEAQRLITQIPAFKELFESQVSTWRHLWDWFDIGMETQDIGMQKKASLVLRLHAFHFLQTLSVNSMGLDVGVPARGWHGEAYRGHIFWDDILVFRFLNLRMPYLIASLLTYRYRRLDEARRLAKESGYRGAMFPWQSGSNGQEETPTMYLNPLSTGWIEDNSHLQRHVNSAIVYNIWQYYEVTGDTDFLFSYGAEMILEIARFWASMATYNKALDRYDINGVVGPDEFHDRYPDDNPKPGLKNNTYTNVMAVWTLCRALDVLEILAEDYKKLLCDKLHLLPDEIRHWDDLSRKMRITYLQEEGSEEAILNQFEGFETLQELDWDQYRKKYGNVQRMDVILNAEGESPNRYKVLKQADVLMLFYLFSYDELNLIFQRLGCPFSREMIPKCIDYYQKRTSHGSTLSRVVYSWVLSRMDRARSFALFIEAFESDLNDIQGGTTPEGIHLGAMAGTIDIVQRCYTGLVAKESVLWFNPRLPKQITSIRFVMHYRFHALRIELTQKQLKITALQGVAHVIKIGFENRVYELKAGHSKVFKLENGQKRIVPEASKKATQATEPAYSK
jgi:beta-phosphoglucomutase family hydrolase